MFSEFARRYDAKNVARSLESQNKKSGSLVPFGFDTSLAFARRDRVDSFAEFVELSEAEIKCGSYFDPFMDRSCLRRVGNRVFFRSDIRTEQDSNNEFQCVYDPSRKKEHAVVVVNHWFARERYPAFAKFFNALGLSVMQVPLPHHFERRQSGYLSEQFILNANLGLTLHSMRQAVLDVRKVVRWLKDQGYRRISLVGMCLGGLVTGLVAAHEPLVDNAVIMVSAGSLAGAVWTGETLVGVKKKIEPHLTLEQLRRAWALVDLETYVQGLTRPHLRLKFVLGKQDTIVRPEVTQRILDALDESGCDYSLDRLSCGHSSVGMFPYNLLTAVSVARFLKARRGLPWYAVTPEGL